MRALAPVVSALTRLVAAPRLSGKSRRVATKCVAVEREERVSAAARVADSPLTVEARGEGGVRVALVPSAHLHPLGDCSGLGDYKWLL